MGKSKDLELSYSLMETITKVIGGKQEGAGTLYNKNKEEIKKGTWINGVFSIPLQK